MTAFARTGRFDRRRSTYWSRPPRSARIYLTLAYTGLRIGELSQLTRGELTLTTGNEAAEIQARKQRGREVRNTDRVFHVSSSLLRWLKLDAEWAGIGLFHLTAMGRRFYEVTMPALVEATERLNRNLERSAAPTGRSCLPL